MERQVHHLQYKFQIMTMKKVEYSQTLKVENEKLKQRLDESKRELAAKNERIEIMEASLEIIAKVSLEMLECRQLAKVYSLFLKDKWHKNQIACMSQQVRYKLKTLKDFLDACQSCSMGEKVKMCEFYFHNMILPHPYKWNPNPYIVDAQIKSLPSWLRHEELRATDVKRYKEDELHNHLWIRVEVENTGDFIAIHSILTTYN
jgi:hypothetical protein